MNVTPSMGMLRWPGTGGRCVADGPEPVADTSLPVEPAARPGSPIFSVTPSVTSACEAPVAGVGSGRSAATAVPSEPGSGIASVAAVGIGTGGAEGDKRSILQAAGRVFLIAELRLGPGRNEVSLC